MIEEKLVLDTLTERREFEEAFDKGVEPAYLVIVEMIRRRIAEHQARGEHDPAQKSKYIRKVRRSI